MDGGVGGLAGVVVDIVPVYVYDCAICNMQSEEGIGGSWTMYKINKISSIVERGRSGMVPINSSTGRCMWGWTIGRGVYCTRYTCDLGAGGVPAACRYRRHSDYNCNVSRVGKRAINRGGRRAIFLSSSGVVRGHTLCLFGT